MIEIPYFLAKQPQNVHKTREGRYPQADEALLHFVSKAHAKGLPSNAIKSRKIEKTLRTDEQNPKQHKASVTDS